jgi:PAS domain S-box-containing protein
MFAKNIISDSNLVDETTYALLEALPDAVYLTDPEGIILNTNTRFAAQFGKNPKECIGSNVYELITTVLQMPELAACHTEKSEEVLQSGNRVVFADESNIRKVTISPLLSAEDKGTRLLVTIQDISERKRMESELIESKARFSQALDAASAGIWEWDLKTGALIWSDEIWALYGIEQRLEKPTFQDWATTVHPDDREMAIQNVTAAASNETEMYIEYRVCYPDGSIHWLMSRGMPLRDDNGLATRYIGTIIDITERKQSESELIESKKRFTYALDAARSGIWEWKVETDELSWSKQVWGLYGLEENSVALNNQLCVDTIHPDDRDMASWIIRNAVSKGAAASLEYRTCHPDGSVHWLTSRGMPLRDADGRVTRYIGTIIDITERKEIEIALSESQTRLNQSLKAASAGVWEWNLNTGENTWSDEIWPLYGMERVNENPSFELWTKSIHNDDREMAIRTVSEAARNEIELNVEYRVCYPDCSTHWLLSRGKPIFDDKGKAIRYIGTVIDITGRKQTELALSENKKRFTFALEATNAGVWEWDVIADNVIWSDQIWALYGLELNCMEPSHKLCASTVHPDDWEVTFQNVMRAVQKEIDVNIEYRVCHRDGSIHWLMCRGMPLRDADGRVTRYIGTVMDITERRELLESLRSSEANYRSLFNNMLHGFAYCKMIYDKEIPLDFMYLDVNQSFERLTGHKNVIGKRISELIPGIRESSEEMFRIYDRVAQTSNPEQFEYYIERLNEWYSISVYSQKKGYFVVLFDIITERKCSEQKILEAKATLEAALASMSDAVFISDTEGQFINFNDAFATYHRFRNKEECASTFAEYPAILDVFLANGELAPVEQWAVPRALRGETAANDEYTLRRKDTGETWVGSYGFAPIRNTGGEIIGTVIAARDITEQKLAETAIRESEHKFRSIFDHAPVAISIEEIQHTRLIDVNASWLQLFGYSREEFMNQNSTDFGTYLETDERELIVRTIKEDGRILNRHLQLRNKSGENINVLYSAEIMKLNARHVLLVMMMDITLPVSQQHNIIQLEILVADRTRKLELEVERLHRFISMISHEYRTPLAIIRGNVDLINLKINSGKSLNQHEMNKINRAIDRLVDVMEVSIQESRVLDSQTTTVLMKFQIAPVIASQLEGFRAMWAERNILYSEHLDACEIFGEPSQIKLAIFNLLDNARKYSPPDSTITLDSRIENGEVVIRIQNQGESFKPEEGEALFEKYQRGRNSMNTGGAGLGLWLVRSIINQHNGNITLTGSQSCVEAKVRLPLIHDAC